MVGEVGGAASVQSSRTYSCNTSRPSWLQTTLADLDEKMKTLALNLQEEDDSDSFAERAENYYRKRPQLLNLLQDLYNGYLCLADRYCQALIKQPQNTSSISTVSFEIGDDEEFQDSHHHHHHNRHQSESDVESCLSFQHQQQLPAPSDHTPSALDSEAFVTQLVIQTVDYEILLNELGILGKCSTESSRKMELQKSLLEVLESERLILLNENARLGFRVATLVEENKGLASDSVLMKRKASELARCVLKMREDHRVCLLSRKIEDLQGQIYGLEKRNKEYYEKLARRGGEEEKDTKKKREVDLDVCFEVEKLKLENQKLKEEAMLVKKEKEGWRRVSSFRWWGRVKNFDLFSTCGPNYNSSRSAYSSSSC